MNHYFDYAVVGGDMRQVYLAEELARSGARICHYGLCALPDKCRLYHTDSLQEACTRSSCVIGPIPLSRNGIHLNLYKTDASLSLEQLLAGLHAGQSFFAGCIPEPFRETAADAGVQVFDLMQNLPLTMKGALATAEGAICEAIKRSPLNLHQSCCAVLGYGKCGRTLSRYLKGMFCNLYVSSDREEELAQALLLADRTGTLKEWEACAGEFDFIFNTIPAITMTAAILKKLKSSVTVIDIASSPGGLDFAAAQELGINAVQCPGLPGRYAPLSSALAIKETVEQWNGSQRSD